MQTQMQLHLTDPGVKRRTLHTGQVRDHDLCQLAEITKEDFLHKEGIQTHDTQIIDIINIRIINIRDQEHQTVSITRIIIITKIMVITAVTATTGIIREVNLEIGIKIMAKEVSLEIDMAIQTRTIPKRAEVFHEKIITRKMQKENIIPMLKSMMMALLVV